MKVYIKIILFFSFTFFSFCIPQKNTLPHIIHGNLDLRQIDIQKYPNFPLHGEWRFSPGVFQFETSEGSHLVSIPETPNWNDSIGNKNKDGFGIGTYQITIQLPENTPKLAIHLVAMHSDCQIFQDSKQIGEFGSIDDESSSFEKMPRVFSLKPTEQSTIKLTLLIKNRFYKYGGIRIPPIFGLEESIQENIRISILQEALLAGGLVFLGLYQLGIYFTRKKVLGSLYFFLFCILMFFQILSTGSQSLFLVVGKEMGELVYRTDLFTEYAGVIAGLFYIHCLTKEYIPQKFIYGYSLLILIPILNTIFGSLQSISRYHFIVLGLIIPILIVLFYLIFCYIKDKRSGFIYLGLSVIFLIGAATNDIVHTLLHKTEPSFLNIGLLLFVFFQSLFLSKHISGEIVSAEIKFKDVLFQLIQSEKLSSIGMTVTSVAHEINSPLSAVILTSDSIRDNISDFFRQLPELESISKKSFPFVLSLIEHAMTEQSLPTGLEFRQKKGIFLNELEKHQILYSDQYAEIFVTLGILEIPQDWIQLLSQYNSKSLVLLAEKIVNILLGTNAIQTSANRAIKIAQALKNFTHFDPKAEIKTIQLSDSLHQILTILQGSLKHGVELKTNFVNIPPINCYPDELNQVWTNMIQNAIQSMNGKGNLTIEINQTVLKNNPFAYVSIEDSGPGVSKEILDKIFDPFFTTKPIGQGTGLGLYISKQIIEKHKGIIDVISTKGNTKFIVYLPYLDKTNVIKNESV
ncbi:ATP-binding protein [Leptospira biflexa]|uniref:ATP-binding protein n=1 Tax=Leptospira biflexa TaxID=172 RepID=UPI001083EAD4|nr:ATP-binding protein [Leptospira biflexa]TGM35021.1 histidine kinase [Leptospira biflexa]TGM38546.1 histidine kinase [Leptospira biflexa]